MDRITAPLGIDNAVEIVRYISRCGVEQGSVSFLVLVDAFQAAMVDHCFTFSSLIVFATDFYEVISLFFIQKFNKSPKGKRWSSVPLPCLVICKVQPLRQAASQPASFREPWVGLR